MKVIIIYRPNSEHARDVDTFAHDFQARCSWVKLELLNVDERDGVAKASVYGITQYPAIMVMTDDGMMLNMWEGLPMPMIDEVASYTLST